MVLGLNSPENKVPSLIGKVMFNDEVHEMETGWTRDDMSYTFVIEVN